MKKPNVKTTVFHTAMTLLLPIVIYIAFALITKGAFGGWMALRTVGRQTIIPVIIAMAISFDMLQGTWDFPPAVWYMHLPLSAQISVQRTGQPASLPAAC